MAQQIDVISTTTITPEIDLVVKFSRSYVFEGNTYDSLDLEPLNSLTTLQLCECEKRFETSGNFSVLKEMNLQYALIVASTVTKLPIEFFNNLPAKEAMKIRNMVSSFFFDKD